MFNNEEMLTWIKNETAQNGSTPTQAKIAAHFGVSVVSIHRRLQRQARRGKIDIAPRSACGVSFNGEPALTAAQFQIKTMLDKGMTQSAIAKALGVSSVTVWRHVKRLKDKGVGVIPVGVSPVCVPETSEVPAAAAA